MKHILKEELMTFKASASNKEEVFNLLIRNLDQLGYLKDALIYKESVMKREEISSTAMGNGIAIPHGMGDFVKEAAVAFVSLEKPIIYDDQEVDLIFMIASTDKHGEHLDMISTLASSLMSDEIVEKIRKSKNASELYAALDTEKEETQQQATKGKIVAVTACATGIAHTYMAATQLEETAKKMGYEIKVETNGSSGVGNRLTKKDIKEADAIIIAADIKVEHDRFIGKKLIEVPIAKALGDSEKLIKDALNAKVYKNMESMEQSNKKEKKGSGIYRHLLNGVSHMLPFVIGGGIVIALAFLVDGLLGVPASELGQLGSYNAFAKMLNDIGGMAFSFMLPVLAGYIAYSISDRPGLVTGFVAGGIASAGGSGFLGALIGGFVAGYSMNIIRNVLKTMPRSLDGIRTILLYPVLGILVTGFLMLLINMPMEQINISMNQYLNDLSGTNALLLGAMLGGMMAIDLGGPINKAAYVFATGTLTSMASGGSVPMAAVMAGGMVPPLAVFVATRLFKEKFSTQDYQAGITNLVLGASFITEGAIPFASADPIRAIPSFVIGSAITGALVMVTGIGVPAPHGGIFVIFLVSKPLFYIIYIAVGSIISGLIYGFLKRK